MSRQRIVDGHSDPRTAIERAVFAGRLAQRDEEVVDADEDAGDGCLLRDGDRDFNLLRAAAAPFDVAQGSPERSRGAQRRKQETLLEVGGVGNACGNSSQVAGRGVTAAAAAGAIEVRPARFRIAGEDRQRPAWIAVAGNCLDALMKEMGEIDYFRPGQRRLVRSRRADCRADGVAEPIAKHDGRSNQVRAAVGALGRTAVTIDAVFGVDGPSAIGGGVVHALTFVWPALRERADTEEDE